MRYVWPRGHTWGHAVPIACAALEAGGQMQVGKDNILPRTAASGGVRVPKLVGSGMLGTTAQPRQLAEAVEA